MPSENLIKRLGATGLLNYSTFIYAVGLSDGGDDCVREISELIFKFYLHGNKYIVIQWSSAFISTLAAFLKPIQLASLFLRRAE